MPDAPHQQPRLILYVGKGGVGKTTLASATAVRAATLGYRTLAVSTDIAHSLGDALGVDLDPDPKQLAPNLWAQEINVLAEAQRTWGKFQNQVSDFLKREGVSDIQAGELAIMPGMEEVAALVQIRRQSQSGDFDCIVVDAAPTGETIRLLSMPDSVLWYAQKLQSWQGKLLKFAMPIVRTAVPDLDVMKSLNDMASDVKELRASLTNADKSSYRIVVTPDQMVLKEARRAETYLNLFEYPIDAVMLNRVIPEDGERSPYLDALIAKQRTLVTSIRTAFSTLPIFQALLSTVEPIGIDKLHDLALAVFGDADPTTVFHRGPTQRIVKTDRGWLLSIPMPNVDAGRLELTKRGDELFVNIGNVRREITLPATLATLEPGDARIHDGALEVPFLEPAVPARR